VSRHLIYIDRSRMLNVRWGCRRTGSYLLRVDRFRGFAPRCSRISRFSYLVWVNLANTQYTHILTKATICCPAVTKISTKRYAVSQSASQTDRQILMINS